MAVGADQHASLSVPEDVVLFQQTYGEKGYTHQTINIQVTKTRVTGKKICPRHIFQTERTFQKLCDVF